MKVTWAVILSLGYLAAVYGLPAKHEPREEFEFIPIEDQTSDETAVVDVSPWFGNFDGFFESVAGMMARMRQQMDYFLRQLPFRNGTAGNSPFPGFAVGIPDLDLSKGNTTSVTKVIDGHKVVINETEYKQEGENGGAFFKVRIIDVVPDSSEMTTEKNAESITSSPKDTESVENSFENEIPKNREIEEIETFEQPAPVRKVEDIETFESMEDGPVKASLPLQVHYSPQTPKWDSIEPFESFEDNSIDYRPYDLSRDTYVNQLMADAGAPHNPDAEVFSDVEFVSPYGSQRHFEKITRPR